MTRYYLSIHLKSDTTFGRGAGVAGLVDVEIEHDQFGCPFIGGRALKGLLVEEWANLRFALGTDSWDKDAAWLFGISGNAHAHLHVGAATLPPDLCAAIRRDVENEPPRLQAYEVLAGLTAIRRQTAISAESGAPDRASLRAMRVLLRETDLIASLDFDTDFPPDRQDRILGLLAACTLAVRRGGTGRNRGRGRLSLLLHPASANHELPADYRNASFTHSCFAAFTLGVR